MEEKTETSPSSSRLLKRYKLIETLLIHQGLLRADREWALKRIPYYQRREAFWCDKYNLQEGLFDTLYALLRVIIKSSVETLALSRDWKLSDVREKCSISSQSRKLLLGSVMAFHRVLMKELSKFARRQRIVLRVRSL